MGLIEGRESGLTLALLQLRCLRSCTQNRGDGAIRHATAKRAAARTDEQDGDDVELSPVYRRGQQESRFLAARGVEQPGAEAAAMPMVPNRNI